MEQVQILFSFYLSDHYSITNLPARKFQPYRMGINKNNRKFTINLASLLQRRKKCRAVLFYIAIFSHLCTCHGQNQVPLKLWDFYLMTQ